jgi:hypothetical protein
VSSNLDAGIIDSYYGYTFIGNGQVISSEIVPQMTISALGGSRYNRIVNVVTQNLH